MSNYIRAKIAGGYYFFTVVTYRRRPILCDEPIRTALKNAIKQTQSQYPFEMIAIVLLPDHLHCIWKMPDDDYNYGKRWGIIKSLVSKQCREYHAPQQEMSYDRYSKNHSGIWQNRFYEHFIRNEWDFNNHLNYIHYNPVKHGLVARPKDWQFSTFYKYVKLGFYDENWGDDVQIIGDFE